MIEDPPAWWQTRTVSLGSREWSGAWPQVGDCVTDLALGQAPLRALSVRA